MENREELEKIIEAAVEKGVEKGIEMELKKRRRKHFARIVLLGAAAGCAVGLYLNRDKLPGLVRSKKEEIQNFVGEKAEKVGGFVENGAGTVVHIIKNLRK